MLKDKNEGYWALWATDFPFMPIPFDTVLSLTYQANGTVLDTPIEENAFESYNKKIDPLQITLNLAFEGNPYWQAAILLELRLMQNLAAKLVLVTPSGVYTDMTLTTFTFKQEEKKGKDLLVIESTLREVMDVSSWFSVRNVARHIPKTLNELMAKIKDHVAAKEVSMVQTQGVSGLGSLLG